MNIKGKCHFIMVDSVPQTPWDLPHYEQKHEKRAVHYTLPPCLLLPALALRLLPSIALSSRLVMKNNMNLNRNKRNILTKNKFVLNMEDILMVKPDNSRATKTGHFYLSLTGDWYRSNIFNLSDRLSTETTLYLVFPIQNSFLRFFFRIHKGYDCSGSRSSR